MCAGPVNGPVFLCSPVLQTDFQDQFTLWGPLLHLQSQCPTLSGPQKNPSASENDFCSSETFSQSVSEAQLTTKLKYCGFLQSIYFFSFFLNVTTSSISNCIQNSRKFPLHVELFPLCESSFSWRNSLVFMAPASQQECDRGNLLVWEQDDGSSEPRGTPDELKYPLSNVRQQYT